MFIPRYWSEARHREHYPDGRQATVRRFGWSSSSQEDADVHARQRVEEALAVLREGGPDALRDFTRRERVVAYSGADGLPIREEIVSEWEDADVVVTRNVYGALCLNTTRAMFVDVDRPESHVAGCGCMGGLIGAVIGGIAAPLLLDLFWLLGAVAGAGMSVWVTRAYVRLKEWRNVRVRDPIRWAIERAKTWCESRPDWCVVAYETPAGARLLPIHAPFDAGEESSFEFMSYLEADPLYVRMCRLQKCYRARVSPKPWRTGIRERFRAGGTWPVQDEEKLAARAKWVRRYELHAGDYASCRLAAIVGEGQPDPRVEEVRRLHDEMCQAESDLQLA